MVVGWMRNGNSHPPPPLPSLSDSLCLYLYTTALFRQYEHYYTSMYAQITFLVVFQCFHTSIPAFIYYWCFQHH